MKYAGRLAAVALVGALSLAACGTDNNTAGTDASARAAATAPRVRRRSERHDQRRGLLGPGERHRPSGRRTSSRPTPGASINYQPSGSGAGVQAFIQGTVAFAGSDSALKDDKGEPAQADARCKTGKAINIPMVTGPVAVVYNLPGVDGLQLSPKTLARHLQQQDHQVGRRGDQGRQPGRQAARRPPIQAFHRSDESGTSDNFTKFLSRPPADWPYEPPRRGRPRPRARARRAPTASPRAVKGAEGAISYVELSFAENSSLPKAKVANGSGEFVELDPGERGARRSRPPRSRAPATTSS